MQHYVGDLESAFPAAIAARATASSVATPRREIILFVLDARHAHWAHNLLLNLDELGLGSRALGIGSSQEACAALLHRVTPGTLSCGKSTFLRRESGNLTLTRALKKWRIGDGHVYHLWWQRWRYLSWAVRLGYNAMSLDTDISLRADPYALFHGTLSHRQLFVGLDSEVGGDQRPGLFPMINVGLVYCQRCAPDGAANVVLSEVVRRVHAFLDGPLLWKTKSRHTMIAERVLWEQDLFKDALLHVAFDLPPHESRHARANANPPPEGFARDPRARERTWRLENVTLDAATPPQPWPWLSLRDESAMGLPLYIFSPWNVPPHGAACAGQWAMRPPPVMIGHLVGCTAKHLIMRQLGWWHYEVSAADALAAAPSVPSAPQPATKRAFPEDARVLVLRAHELQMNGPQDVTKMWSVIRRFAMLALALGRRAVLPLVPYAPPEQSTRLDAPRALSHSPNARLAGCVDRCALSPCAPRVPNPLRSSLSTVTLGDAAACAETFSDDGTTELGLIPRAVDSPLGWRPSPDTSRWWWTPNRRNPHVRPGCCQPIPHYASCIDPAGARRPLGAEALLSTADLGRLLAESHHQPPSHRAPGLNTAAPSGATIKTVALPASWADEAIDELEQHAKARVLVLDTGRLADARLPSIEWLVRRGGAGTAAEEAIGAHASKCFVALGKE